MKYFRVLYDDKLWKCWHSDPVAKSSHHRPPLQWIDKWDKHDKNSSEVLESHYPLICVEGLKDVKFTARARQVFLADPAKFTPKYITEHWDSKEIYEVGQLDGICAFTSAQACLDWVKNDPTKRQNAHNFYYVVFEGTYVSEAPEDAGVVAEMLNKIGEPMRLGEFENRYLRT
jgi:hypothetical protein